MASAHGHRGHHQPESREIATNATDGRVCIFFKDGVVYQQHCRRLGSPISENREVVKVASNAMDAGHPRMNLSRLPHQTAYQSYDVSTSFNVDAELHECPERDLGDDVANARASIKEHVFRRQTAQTNDLIDAIRR